MVLATAALSCCCCTQLLLLHAAAVAAHSCCCYTKLLLLHIAAVARLLTLSFSSAADVASKTRLQQQLNWVLFVLVVFVLIIVVFVIIWVVLFCHRSWFLFSFTLPFLSHSPSFSFIYSFSTKLTNSIESRFQKGTMTMVFPMSF